jgi:hypothetical protein
MAKETTKKTTTAAKKPVKKATTSKAKAKPAVEQAVVEPTSVPRDPGVADKLIALSRLQETYTKIDHIKTLRGELPLEVQDLEDELAGMETRLKHLEEDNKRQKQGIATEKARIVDAEEKIQRYKEQLDNVKNNREYDNLAKEIEFQGLEIELSQKRINEGNVDLQQRSERISELKSTIAERRIALEAKQEELARIKNETKQEEEALRAEAINLEEGIEERLLHAFSRIREGARNGLAVVPIDRDACGGCFNKIPPQRQVDLKLHKKIIVCEYCGRILVDPELIEEAHQHS